MWSFTVWCCCFWYRIFVTLLQTRAQSFLGFFWPVSRVTSGKTKSQNTLGMRLATGFLGCAIELEFVDIKNSYSYNDKTDLSVERLLSSSGKGRGSTTAFLLLLLLFVFFFQLISPILSPYIYCLLLSLPCRHCDGVYFSLLCTDVCSCSCCIFSRFRVWRMFQQSLFEWRYMHWWN